MKRIYLTCLLLLLFISINAQTKFNHTWVSGIFKTYHIKYDGIQFVFSDSIYSLSYIQLRGANICDSSGNVALMSSGYNIFNSTKNIIENGDSIGGRSLIKYYSGFSTYAQTCLFLPVLDSIYYMPYITASDSEFYKWMNISGHDCVFDILGYCKIDMKKNGGLGKVIKREIPLLENETLSKCQMMACKHANGRDWWLLKQARGVNRIFKFLFTQDSVYNYGIQTFAEPIFSTNDLQGQSMFNEQGTQYASTCEWTEKVFVADFDRCQGILSNPKVYNVARLNANNPFDTTIIDQNTEGLCLEPLLGVITNNHNV